MKAIDFYNANATNIVNVPRVGHPEDKSGCDGVRRASNAGDFAKDAPVMSLADACDFAEKYAEAERIRVDAMLAAYFEYRARRGAQ